MYPYRRSNQRKRSRNTPRRKQGGGRRLPGSARELLPLIQPATKALAQVLAGNTKASGQFVHARHVVDRADQMIGEKQLDRLTLRDREEFLEQLARLKLTINDAEAEFGPLEAEGEGEDDLVDGDEDAADEVVEEVDEEAERALAEAERQRQEEAAAAQRERLRRVALALMSPPSAEAPLPPPSLPEIDTVDTKSEPQAPARARRSAPANRDGGARSTAAARRPRITLRASERDTSGDGGAGDTDEHGVVSER